MGGVTTGRPATVEAGCPVLGEDARDGDRGSRRRDDRRGPDWNEARPAARAGVSPAAGDRSRSDSDRRRGPTGSGWKGPRSRPVVRPERRSQAAARARGLAMRGRGGRYRAHQAHQATSRARSVARCRSVSSVSAGTCQRLGPRSGATATSCRARLSDQESCCFSDAARSAATRSAAAAHAGEIVSQSMKLWTMPCSRRTVVGTPASWRRPA
jgi:hypothetical protein